MVHHRINTTEPNPNPHVNFITALPMPQPEDQERARQLLRALAAQVKPVMKTHGFVVNSLEEVGVLPLERGAPYERRSVRAQQRVCGKKLGIRGGRRYVRSLPTALMPVQTICTRTELVLRRPDSTFQPTPWLMSTLCHEVRYTPLHLRL